MDVWLLQWSILCSDGEGTVSGGHFSFSAIPRRRPPAKPQRNCENFGAKRFNAWTFLLVITHNKGQNRRSFGSRRILFSGCVRSPMSFSLLSGGGGVIGEGFLSWPSGNNLLIRNCPPPNKNSPRLGTMQKLMTGHAPSLFYTNNHRQNFPYWAGLPIAESKTWIGPACPALVQRVAISFLVKPVLFARQLAWAVCFCWYVGHNNAFHLK